MKLTLLIEYDECVNTVETVALDLSEILERLFLLEVEADVIVARLTVAA